MVYVIIKAANSPRPGNWILERSLDGKDYEAWQYYAVSDKECLDRYGIPGRKGKPHYDTDSEVICTSFYSKLTPMENGEVSQYSTAFSGNNLWYFCLSIFYFLLIIMKQAKVFPLRP